MNFAALRPTIESAIRLVLVFLAGKLGFDLVDSQAGTVAAIVASIILGAASLLWSKWSDKKVVETVKPTNGGVL